MENGLLDDGDEGDGGRSQDSGSSAMSFVPERGSLSTFEYVSLYPNQRDTLHIIGVLTQRNSLHTLPVEGPLPASNSAQTPRSSVPRIRVSPFCPSPATAGPSCNPPPLPVQHRHTPRFVGRVYVSSPPVGGLLLSVFLMPLRLKIRPKCLFHRTIRPHPRASNCSVPAQALVVSCASSFPVVPSWSIPLIETTCVRLLPAEDPSLGVLRGVSLPLNRSGKTALCVLVWTWVRSWSPVRGISRALRLLYIGKLDK